MTTKPQTDITLVIEHDGSVMLNAADVVAWLRKQADAYGEGQRGGTPTLRRGARLALAEVADGIQGAYIDKAADIVLDNWRPTP